MPIGLKIKKLLKENQQGGHIVPPPSRNRVKTQNEAVLRETFY